MSSPSLNGESVFYAICGLWKCEEEARTSLDEVDPI